MPENILFVDDEENILRSVERIFLGDNVKDVRILKAKSAQEALQFIEKENIAVLVSDNLMPDMKGIELLSKVKEISPDTVRILMTAYADLPTAIDAINKGEVYRFIVKPWENSMLIEIVHDGINRFKIVRALRRADEPMLLSLAQTVELKDPYTRGHCDRVAGYALMIAEALKLEEGKKNEIKYGSWLHDCGKIGVPERILNYNGPLGEAETDIMKKHPLWGADVARQAQLSAGVVNVILYHHERYDGQGYPSGIGGKNIPLEARIVSVADAFDAMTTDRPYHKQRDTQEALGIISSLKGKSLDPEVVDIFLSIIQEKLKSGDNFFDESRQAKK